MTAPPSDLPPRLTTSEVCALGRFSVSTFSRRRREGRILIEPCDRGSELLWNRDEVLRAFNMIPASTPIEEAPKPKVDPDAIRAARAGQVRQRQIPQGRDRPRPVRGSGKAPALRLAFDASASD